MFKHFKSLYNEKQIWQKLFSKRWKKLNKTKKQKSQTGISNGHGNKIFGRAHTAGDVNHTGDCRIELNNIHRRKTPQRNVWCAKAYLPKIFCLCRFECKKRSAKKKRLCQRELCCEYPDIPFRTLLRPGPGGGWQRKTSKLEKWLQDLAVVFSAFRFCITFHVHFNKRTQKDFQR